MNNFSSMPGGDGSPHNTPLTPDEEVGLKHSIQYRSQLNILERLNIAKGRAWAFSEASKHPQDCATDFFARALHHRMFCDVWEWAGKYRKTERNLGWEPHRISEGMRNLMEDFRTWLQFDTHPPHEAVVRLHHRMVVIHPWPNGNGRHTRLMADVLLAAFFKNAAPLRWGGGVDLITAGELRKKYIEALREADNGNIHPLLDFARG